MHNECTKRRRTNSKLKIYFIDVSSVGLVSSSFVLGHDRQGNNKKPS